VVITILSGLIYLNLGLYVEFLWSYYLDYFQFIDFDWSEGVQELNQQIEKPTIKNHLRLQEQKPPGIYMNMDKVVVEIDEFKELFISILSGFSGQYWFCDLSVGNSTSKITYSQFFNIYFIYLFYPVTLTLGYHTFCFIAPGVLSAFRPIIFKYLQNIFLGLTFHWLILPHLVTISEEFAHESVDSELFVSTHFDFVSSWSYCFYLLLVLIVFFFFKRTFR
jgi:hypothetical protein